MKKLYSMTYHLFSHTDYPSPQTYVLHTWSHSFFSFVTYLEILYMPITHKGSDKHVGGLQTMGVGPTHDILN
jgi:hypothetical protein